MKKKYFVGTNSEKKYIPNFLIDRDEKNLIKKLIKRFEISWRLFRKKYA